MLRLDNLEIGFNEGKPVFKNINAQASSGEIIALLGVNGIGKSSLLRTISGIQTPLSGAVFCMDFEVEKANAAELGKWISMVTTERIYIDNITIQEFVALGRAPHTGWFGNLSKMDWEVIESALEISQLQDMQQRLFNHLSDGEKQRVMIARAIAQCTPILILDEPTAYLDFHHKIKIHEVIKAATSRSRLFTTIFSTHDIQAALKHADVFWLMTEEKEFVIVQKTDPDYEQIVKSKLHIEQFV